MAQTRGTAKYNSDDTNSYDLCMNAAHYAASGLAAGADDGAYPKHWTPRKVHGVDSTGLKHVSVPVGADDPKFVGSTTTITVGPTTYNITGRSGEKRPNLAKPWA